MCPCCGLYEHSRTAGNHGVCPICLWEDDRQQRNDVNISGGANNVSLKQARAMFAKGMNVEGEQIKIHLYDSTTNDISLTFGELIQAQTHAASMV